MVNLLPCRSIGGLVLKRNDALRTLLIENEALVSFTPMEYQLMTILLNSEIVADEELTKALFHTGNLDRLILKNLEKHVENIKHKLKYTRLYIRRIHRYGYSLIARSAVEQTEAVAS